MANNKNNIFIQLNSPPTRITSLLSHSLPPIRMKSSLNWACPPTRIMSSLNQTHPLSNITSWLNQICLPIKITYSIDWTRPLTRLMSSLNWTCPPTRKMSTLSSSLPPTRIMSSLNWTHPPTRITSSRNWTHPLTKIISSLDRTRKLSANPQDILILKMGSHLPFGCLTLHPQHFGSSSSLQTNIDTEHAFWYFYKWQLCMPWIMEALSQVNTNAHHYTFTLIGTTTLGQRRPGCKGKEGVLQIPEHMKWNLTTRSSLVSLPGNPFF